VTAEKPTHATLARVLRPHGRRGEVAAEILTDFPERLKTLKEAELWDGKLERSRTPIRSCRLSMSRGGQAIFHFEGSDSINDAERLVGREVQVPIGERVVLPAGSYFVTDLIGCDVREGGQRIGTVVNVETFGERIPGTPILNVDAAGRELLVPLAREICVRIDTYAKQIDVVLPAGLRELNRG
jgi:16S rRNA processing protein RimM